jgi:hypothetical protein
MPAQARHSEPMDLNPATRRRADSQVQAAQVGKAAVAMAISNKRLAACPLLRWQTCKRATP